MSKLIFDARVGPRRIRMRQMVLDGETVYNIAITGRGWSLGGFWSKTAPEKRLEYAIQEIAAEHPFTKWTVLIGQEILDSARDINQIWIENLGYNSRFAGPRTADEIFQELNSRHYVRPKRTLSEVQSALDKLVTQNVYSRTTGQSGKVYYAYRYESQRKG